MAIDDTKNLGDWGKMIPVSNNIHITQTNPNADVGDGAHVTTQVPGVPVKVHDFFDSDGNYLGSGFGKN